MCETTQHLHSYIIILPVFNIEEKSVGSEGKTKPEVVRAQEYENLAKICLEKKQSVFLRYCFDICRGKIDIGAIV